jgi:hypothetical protein
MEVGSESRKYIHMRLENVHKTYTGEEEDKRDPYYS